MTNINQTIDNENIFEQPLKLAMFPDETGKIKVDPEERPYTLFIFFVDGYDQEKTFKFAIGQTAVREYIIENADIIDFEKSLISSWTTKPCDPDGFITLVQFMHYLDTITDDEGNKWFEDDFDIQEYLESQIEIDTISDEERDHYNNAIHLVMQNSILRDIDRIEEGDDSYDV